MDVGTEQLVGQLDLLSVDAHVAGQPVGLPVLTLSRGDSIASFSLIDGPEVRLSMLATYRTDRAIFVRTPHIPMKTGDAFRRAGVQYLDSAGNAWIEFGDVLIDIRGRAAVSTERGTADRRTRVDGDLFSRGRSQVIMALLAWPRLWKANRREVASVAGVSLGQAQKTLVLLDQAGYGAGRRVREQVPLLDMWAAAFPTGLASRLYLAGYHGDIGWHPQAEVEPAAVSGESAVPDLLRPGTLMLYVREFDPRLALRHRWRSDGEPNVVVRRKFWNDPEPLAEPDGVDADPGIAPWPLVYADLCASDDPRVRQAALKVRERSDRTP